MPAYVKDADLRYIAVNEAYAKLWNRSTRSFIGCMSEDDRQSGDGNERDEKERRTLVFGKNQMAMFRGTFTHSPYRINLRRGKEPTGRTFLLGIFEQFGGVRIFSDPAAPDHESNTDGPGQGAGPDRDIAGENTLSDGLAPRQVKQDDHDLALVRAAMRDLDLPVAIFSKDGRPILINDAFRSTSENAETFNWRAKVAPEGARIVIGEHGRAPVAVGEGPGGVEKQALIAALEHLDAGVIIYDQNDRLYYFNAKIPEFFAGMSLSSPRVGMSLEEVVTELYDAKAVVLREGDSLPEDRQEWIRARIKDHHRDDFDSVEELRNGRCLRFINRRLPNGMFIGLRVDITEQRQRESELRRHAEENDLFKAVLDALPIATYVKSPDFKLRFVNRAYCDLTGRPLEEIIGRDDLEIYGDEGVIFRAEDERVLATGEISEQEETLTDSHGEPLQLLARKSLARGTDGKLWLIGSSLDIRALKRREDELFDARLEAELMRSDLESLIDAMPLGIILLDADLKVELINNAVFDQWNELPRADILGRDFRTILNMNRASGIFDMNDEDWKSHADELINEISAGHCAPREVVQADGRTVVYSVRSLSAGKRLISYFDVSAMKERENEIATARAELEKANWIMEQAKSAMAQGICIHDGKTVQMLNQAFYDLLDIPPDIVGPGKPWRCIIDYCVKRGDFGEGLDVEDVIRSLQKIIDETGSLQAERRGGKGRWLQVDAKMTAGGSRVITYTDITETKGREEQLRSLLVKAEQADRAKSEFLANMSHEIRTPMNGVLGMAELLSKTPLDTRQRTFTDIIVKSGNALLSIINDILDFSRIDAGQIVLEAAPFSLQELIEDVTALLSSRTIEKDIELIVRIPADLPALVIGDAGRLRQILTNLMGNAAKFTEVGHIVISVKAEMCVSGRAKIMISVSDTGIGIPENKLESIFEKFSQVDGSSTRRHEGTGLGLAIAARLTEMMGGHMAVESEEGVGSTFTLSLELPVHTASCLSQKVPPHLTGARVLIVDDNAVSRKAVCEQMSGWRLDACAAGTGAEGLGVLQAAIDAGLGVDAIVLDHDLLDMTGSQFIHAVRANPALDDTPIIFLGTMDFRPDQELAEDLPVEASLMKPVRSSQLFDTLVQVMQAFPAHARAY